MLSWFNRFGKEERPLSSAARARKFAADLEGEDPLEVAERVCALLRDYVHLLDEQREVDVLPLLELDNQLRLVATQLERDWLAATAPNHPLRASLWDLGYEWAMRFSDAYRVALMQPQTLDPESRRVDELALAASCFFAHRGRACRYRLYRHEDWQPDLWHDVNQVFAHIRRLGLDHIAVTTTTPQQPEPVVNFAARAFAGLHLLRLCNDGTADAQQLHLLQRKINQFCYDIKLAPRPPSARAFMIDLDSSEGLQRTGAPLPGGEYVFCDLSTLHARLREWLEQYQDSARARRDPMGTAETADVLRNAIARLDIEMQPAAQSAPVDESNLHRLCATFGAWRVVKAIGFDAAVVYADLAGEVQSALSAAEAPETEPDRKAVRFHIFGAVATGVGQQKRRKLSPEAVPLGFKFWLIAERGETTYRALIPNHDDLGVGLHDVVALADGTPGGGWQLARVMRLMKQANGYIELNLQLLSRAVESIELRSLRKRPGGPSDDYASMIAGQPFRAVRLNNAFLGTTPIVGPSLLLPRAEHQPGLIYEQVGTELRFRLEDAINRGTDWIWLRAVDAH